MKGTFMSIVCLLAAVVGAVSGRVSEEVIFILLLMAPLWWIAGSIYDISKDFKELKSGMMARAAVEIGLVDDKTLDAVKKAINNSNDI